MTCNDFMINSILFFKLTDNFLTSSGCGAYCGVGVDAKT